MEARVLKNFTMGSRTYQKDQVIDLPEDRVIRLVGEGHVETMFPAPAPSQPSETESKPEARAQDAGAPAVSAKPKSIHKKKR